MYLNLLTGEKMWQEKSGGAFNIIVLHQLRHMILFAVDLELRIFACFVPQQGMTIISKIQGNIIDESLTLH